MLTGLMILLFLGSWRSTLIIAVSIPLSILTLHHSPQLLGETINIMTLGGLALASASWWMMPPSRLRTPTATGMRARKVKQAILDGAQQIAVPALVSTLSICIVFAPMFC